MKISIITAAFNSGRTIEDTIRSVLAQSYDDWEHIIIDGASKDDTLAIVRKYAPRYGDRLKLISEPDRGIYDAMNKGLALATGDVVGLLNSDDFFASDEILSRVAAEMQDKRIDAVYGNVDYVDADDVALVRRRYSSADFSRSRMLMGFQPAHPSFYCRREVYERHGRFDLAMKVAADFEMLFRLLYVNRLSSRYIPMTFVKMRCGGASNGGWRSHVNIIRDHFKTYGKHGVYAGYLFDFARYPFKIYDVLKARIKR